MEKHERIYIAGHRGLVGSALERRLRKEGFENLLSRTSAELDLRRQDAVHTFFEKERPDYVFLSAARAGGILAHSRHPAAFLYDNLMIAANAIHAAYLFGVKKLLFVGSACVYPKNAPQPMPETALFSGAPDPSVEPYAIAKIAGIKLCEFYRREYGSRFISVIPTNLYGPNDNYHPQNAHVLAALLQRFHAAKTEKAPFVEVWGTGTVYREFLHVDDLADACLFLMQYYDAPEPVNIGTGSDLTIAELAALIKEITGFAGEIRFDRSKPDGAPQKRMDVSALHRLGWRHQIDLADGIRRVYVSEIAKLNTNLFRNH